MMPCRRRVLERVAFPLALLSLVFFLGSCTPREDIIIGLAGSFSGRDYKNGVEGRNAAELFVRQQNEAGGISGRKLALEIRDFKSDQSLVIQSDRELLEAKAVAIVGHFTSATALAALDFANERKIVLVCPTATAEGLGGKDDYLFRSVMSSGRDPLAISADMASYGRKSLLLIATAQNMPYVETYMVPLRASVRVTDEILFDTLESIDYGRAARLPCDAILIIASPSDSGTIAQELVLRKISKPLYLSGFAATGGRELIESGGRAVEGAWLAHQVDETQAGIAPLVKAYTAIFGVPPSAAAIETWDSMCLVREVLRLGGTDRESFYRVIKSLRSFKGSEGIINMDDFGDATRTLFVRTIRDGEMVITGRFD